MAEKIDPSRKFSFLPIGTVIVANFNHGGQPFRIKFTKNAYDHSTTMHAYSGASGEMNSHNRIENSYVNIYGLTLHECISIRAKKVFDIIPTDITFTATPPAN